MADPKLRPWICFALGLLLLLKTEGLFVGITILESAVAKGAGKGLRFGQSTDTSIIFFIYGIVGSFCISNQ